MPAPLGQPVLRDGVTHWYFPRQTRFYTASWPLTRWLDRHVRDYDLVHIHALFSYAALPAAFFAARQGIPYIVRPLGVLNHYGMQRRRPWLKRLSFALIERQILAHAAYIHFTSEQERSEAADLGITQCSFVAPLGIDPRLFAQLPPAGWLRRRAPHLAGRTSILFLSRLDSKKGLDILLPAFAILNTRVPSTLVLAGDGDAVFVASLREQASCLGLDDSIVWAGFLAAEEKMAALADADLFVLPSYSENFGNAVVEAMACGLPVVISDQVGIHREVAAAGAGLVTTCQVETLVDRLEELSADPIRRRQMGAAGQQLVCERFMVGAVTRQLIELYTSVCSSQSTESSDVMSERPLGS
jgi:glycosyltransferase involved in cell wall biosynthesis